MSTMAPTIRNSNLLLRNPPGSRRATSVLAPRCPRMAKGAPDVGGEPCRRGAVLRTLSTGCCFRSRKLLRSGSLVPAKTLVGRGPGGREGRVVVVDVRTLEGEVRELIRRSGLDPARDEVKVRRSSRTRSGTTTSVPCTAGCRSFPIDAASRGGGDTVAGYGPLQQYFDDPSVEEVWIKGRLTPGYGARGLTRQVLLAGRPHAALHACSPASGHVR